MNPIPKSFFFLSLSLSISALLPSMDRIIDDEEKRLAAIREAASCAVRYIKDDNVPCQIKKGLYLGSLDAARNITSLKTENVTHILTVARGLTPVYPNGFIHKVIHVLNREDENISQHFNECFNFIEEALVMGEGVLVHCFAGRSRSVTIIVAYLMKKYSMSLIDALEYIREKRPVACPNSGFITLLQKYQKSLQAMNGNTDDQQERIPAVVPSQIKKGLYLGSVDAANNRTFLKRENVIHILTVANKVTPAYYNDFKYKTISVMDRKEEDISQYFDECFNFIEEAIQKDEGVLVHCLAGRSRSVTIIVAYLMKTYRMSLVEALEYVREKRPIAYPNSGFIILLQNYEKSLQSTNGKTDDENVPCQIKKGLYLGSLTSARNKTKLESENVTHILIVARFSKHDYPSDFNYKTISVLDREDEDISQYFDECFNFFEEAEKMGGGVSVHSSAGRSRSVTIIVAYLMKKYRMSLIEALEYVREKRPIASPNSGFITLLQNYEKSLWYKESISKVTRMIDRLDLASKDNDDST